MNIREPSSQQRERRSTDDAARRRVQRLAISIAAVLLAGFIVTEIWKFVAGERLAEEARLRASAPPPVDVVTVQSAAATDLLTLPGETAAWYDSTIYARVNGYVGSWSVDFGDRVREGQVMAVIQTPELDAELAAAKARLKAAEADLQVRQAEADFARTTYERWRDSPKGVVSEQEREDKKAGFASANARFAAGQAQVNLVQSEVDRLAALQSFKQVTAPYAGRVTERRIDIGNLVTAGSNAGTTPLYHMVKDDPMRVFVDVPQSAAAELMKPGIEASVTLDNIPGKVFKGPLARAANAVDPKSRTMRVEVDLPNPTGELVSGQYVQVGFRVPNQGTASVPSSALVFQSSGPHVAIVHSDNRVEYRAVTIARDDGDHVMLGSGVSPGEKVILNVASTIAQGEEVKVSEEDGHRLAEANADSKPQ